MPRTTKRKRTNQRLRTRKDLLQAAAALLKEGRQPTMDEVAGRALVSRATAYRYFPDVESLLVEAPLDGAAPTPQELFGSDADGTPEDRLDRAEAALHAMCYQNEAQLRLMLAQALQNPAGKDNVPPARRQNRRTALIEAALAPARERLSKANYDKLTRALALVFGIESMVVFRDVVPLDAATARKVKSWMIHALVQAALRESKRQ